MDLDRVLENYNSLRKVVEEASEQTSGWWRKLFGCRLSCLVVQAKFEYREEFERLFAEVPGLLESLNFCHHAVFYEKIICSLDFCTPGRTIAALAFCTYILDRWNKETHLSAGYTLDYITLQLWKAYMRKGKIYTFSREPRSLQRLQTSLRRRLGMPTDDRVCLLEAENPRAGMDPPSEN
ncbi:control protein E1B 19 kDa [Simian adenovirus DM-2014]|uniref:E1B protein, small T-antigen n=1 Tax=Simian adenovirus DM-2014 TaxID=1560346 RepID=A0A097IW62_9ADEN|nr:control protein E1B 19 kDa [Simian adenovirus DM-2014]AIT70969.1 control protein E1B 19 kDa [Simian adenovirus DM-2014]